MPGLTPAMNPNSLASGQGGLFKPGLRAEFRDAYRFRYKAMLDKLKGIMRLDVTSDKRVEPYAYMKTAPYARRWDQGNAIPEGATETVQWDVTNYRYGIRVGWFKDDEADDQIDSIVSKAREAGDQMATLDERILFQILENTTDEDLLPAIPNAPDGAALYSATDGASANRFGVSGGNIVTGTSSPTAQDIRGYYQDVLARFADFQDTESQPLLPPNVLDGGIMLIYGTELTQEMKEAFVQGQVSEYRAGTDTTDTSTAASVSNVILDSGDRVVLYRTQRVTATNDIYAFALGAPLKPIFRQTREALRESVGNEGNSDIARDFWWDYLQWTLRYGYGVNLPYATIKINNS